MFTKVAGHKCGKYSLLLPHTTGARGAASTPRISPTPSHDPAPGALAAQLNAGAAAAVVASAAPANRETLCLRPEAALSPRPAAPQAQSGFVVVSNRMPVVLQRKPSGEMVAEAAAGGLVTALAPAVKAQHGEWIGYPGVNVGEHQVDQLLRGVERDVGYALQPVQLSDEQARRHYGVMSNGIFWPLFHSMLPHVDAASPLATVPFLMPVEPEDVATYEAVNQEFAQTIVRHTQPHDKVWVHDYHLLFVAQALQEMQQPRDAAFFLHIPFPQWFTLAETPIAQRIVEALLCYNVVGFQAKSRDLANFVRCVRHFLPPEEVAITADPDLPHALLITYKGHTCCAGAFPISIDYDAFANRARHPDMVELADTVRRRAQQGDAQRQVIFSAGRLDYTKGYVEQLKAYQALLAQQPQLRGRLSFLLVTVPSRSDVEGYRDYEQRVNALVQEINSTDYGVRDWVPVLHDPKGVKQDDLPAYYAAADIFLVTPTPFDGKNLVIEEAIACSERAVVIASTGAGATAELLEAGLGDHLCAVEMDRGEVEPLTDALYKAATTPLAQRAADLAKLKEFRRTHNVQQWVNNFMETWQQHQPNP